MPDDTTSRDRTIETIFGRYLAASARRLLITNAYEKGTLLTFRDVCLYLRASHIVDIGANIGVYSICAGRSTRVEQVDAFEPAPAAYNLLERNIATQDFSRKISAHPLALSSKAGTVQFEMYGEMAGNNHILEGSDATGDVITIETARLDDILTYTGNIVCMKIDVEGHEAAVLNGATQFLRNNACFVQIESLDAESFTAVENRMAGLDYRHLYSVVDDHIFIHRSLVRRRRRVGEIMLGHMSSELLALRDYRSSAAIETLLLP